MSLQELKEQARSLSVSDRLELISAIVESLQIESLPGTPSQSLERTHIIQHMKGLLKTDHPAPTDEQVKVMLDERRVERYLS